ncbi:MAG: TlpA disulfide reductase family protein [Cyclobacteriaceae bacterium]
MKYLVIVSLILITSISCQPKEEPFSTKIKLADLTGAALDSELYEDKILILNLWATWCKPCIKEMPVLERMQNELSDDFVLLLASAEELKTIQTFTERRVFDLQFVQIQNSMEALGVYSLPTTFVIGKDGELKQTLVGAQKWDSPEQIQQFKNYLK